MRFEHNVPNPAALLIGKAQQSCSITAVHYKRKGGRYAHRALSIQSAGRIRPVTLYSQDAQPSIIVSLISKSAITCHVAGAPDETERGKT